MRYMEHIRVTNDESLKTMVNDLGFEEYDPGFHWWERIWCRLFGPHIWVPIFDYDIELDELTEGGTICERCSKEMS